MFGFWKISAAHSFPAVTSKLKSPQTYFFLLLSSSYVTLHTKQFRKLQQTRTRDDWAQQHKPINMTPIDDVVVWPLWCELFIWTGSTWSVLFPGVHVLLFNPYLQKTTKNVNLRLRTENHSLTCRQQRHKDDFKTLLYLWASVDLSLENRPIFADLSRLINFFQHFLSCFVSTGQSNHYRSAKYHKSLRLQLFFWQHRKSKWIKTWRKGSSGLTLAQHPPPRNPNDYHRNHTQGPWLAAELTFWILLLYFNTKPILPTHCSFTSEGASLSREPDTKSKSQPSDQTWRDGDV